MARDIDHGHRQVNEPGVTVETYRMDGQPARQGPELQQEWVQALPVIKVQHYASQNLPRLGIRRTPPSAAMKRAAGTKEGVVPGKPQEARRDVHERRDEEIGR